MIPVNYYKLISDQVRKGLEKSYDDVQGAEWEDAKELITQNIMIEVCEYLEIEDEGTIIEFEMDDDDPDE